MAYFDEKAADRAAGFFAQVLRHTKGRWAGEPFELLPWQREVVRDLFGSKRDDGTRLYRTAFVEVPRKNGKSTFAAGLGLYLECCDGEHGAEVYSAAADRDQAAIVFDAARSMVEQSPVLSEKLHPTRKSIVYKPTGSFYRVLSADAYTKHGLNAHGILFDELHAQRSRELYDVLVTSTGARTQPLTLLITTAGYDRESICYEVYDYACKVRDGIVEDPSFYACIYEAEEGDDWTDPEVWRKANPSLGITVSEDYLRSECNRAKQTPAYQNTFRRLHLNQWTRQQTRWLDLASWDACAGALDPSGLEERHEGDACYGGLDLASTSDLAAFVLVIPPEDRDVGVFTVVPRFWMPAENVEERARRHAVPYDAWVRDGWIQATEGNVIDYKAIREEVLRLADRFTLREVAFDRWGSIAVSTDLQEEGLQMVQFGQGFASMSAPSKELESLVLSKRLAHGGHPVLRWMADNLEVKTDPAGNIKPVKPGTKMSHRKIDGMVALIMALSRALANDGVPETSVYEAREMVVL